ncbi:MAG: enoyl-CoA hydratase/isomerase family protein [Mycoplasmatota bacterium]
MENIYKTFKTIENNGVLNVTFDFQPINVLGIPMMQDIDLLCNYLKSNRQIKVVVFDSSIPNFFIAHADIDMLQNLRTQIVPKNQIQINDLAKVLDNLSKLPQVTIAKIDGFARGGGHEFALACDLRYATYNSTFMQMEVGMGILPCGGGSSRLAKIVGLGNALEIILSARDFSAVEAEKYGSINKAFDKEHLDRFVYELANRISQFSSYSIEACKKTIHNSLDVSTEESLKEETYELYYATSKTPAVKRFKYAAQTNFQNNLYNQENFETLLMNLQNIK